MVRPCAPVFALQTEKGARALTWEACKCSPLAGPTCHLNSSYLPAFLRPFSVALFVRQEHSAKGSAGVFSRRFASGLCNLNLHSELPAVFPVLIWYFHPVRHETAMRRSNRNVISDLGKESLKWGKSNSPHPDSQRYRICCPRTGQEHDKTPEKQDSRLYLKSAFSTEDTSCNTLPHHTLTDLIEMLTNCHLRAIWLGPSSRRHQVWPSERPSEYAPLSLQNSAIK
jgi:hypothetical protein